MRTLLTASLTLTALLCLGSFTTATAGASLEIRFGHSGIFAGCDDFLHEDDLLVISDDEVGYWKLTPAGHWVFRYRKVWYDGDRDVWHYGPWMVNVSIGHGCHCHAGFHRYCPVHAVRYHHYVRTYPKVYEVRNGHRVHRHAYDHRPFYRLHKMPRVEYRVERRDHNRHLVERHRDNRQWKDQDCDRHDGHHGQLRKQPSHERRDQRGGHIDRREGNRSQAQVVTTRTTTVKKPSGVTVERKRTSVRESTRQR